MKQVTIAWDDATLDDLKKFSSQMLGMGLGPNIGEETLRGKIRQAYSGDTLTYMVQDEDDHFEVSDAPPQSGIDESGGKALRGTSASKDPKVKITIAEVDGPGGKRPVFCGVNGVGMLISRGKPVDIPYRYYFAMTKAVKTVHEQDPDTHEITSYDVPAYPMSVNVMPPPEEIAAYIEKDQNSSQAA